jgi:deoxyribonuclease V
LQIHPHRVYLPVVTEPRKNLSGELLRICRRKDYKGATAFQERIRDLIPGKPVRRKFRTVCGLDISFDKKSDRVYAAGSVYRLPELEKIEERSLEAFVSFPYVPGLLAFREGPAVVKLLRHIKNRVDLLLFDGQGLAHPRGTGIASMMGLILNMPSIGCAKSRLIGEYDDPEAHKGALSDLMYKEKPVGRVVRTRNNVKPVFVSVGYKVDLKKAVEIVLKCTTRYRIPEPTRAAHILANRLRTTRRIK